MAFLNLARTSSIPPCERMLWSWLLQLNQDSTLLFVQEGFPWGRDIAVILMLLVLGFSCAPVLSGSLEVLLEVHEWLFKALLMESFLVSVCTEFLISTSNEVCFWSLPCEVQRMGRQFHPQPFLTTLSIQSDEMFMPGKKISMYSAAKYFQACLYVSLLQITTKFHDLILSRMQTHRWCLSLLHLKADQEYKKNKCETSVIWIWLWGWSRI